MKLTKIHIDGFGKLVNYDLNFDKKLTSICENNGQGKTTVATFITVMLYGMSKNLKDQKDREHFYPFNGGAYGGKLVFTHEGDTYEVWRQFHKSSKSKDTVRISKNKAAYELPEGQEIGEAILGIDESAFRRVCFIDDNGLDFSQESIAGKLGGLAGDFDAVEVEATIDRILDAIKQIKPLRGNGGLLGDAETRLANTQTEIGRLNGLKEPLMNAQRVYHQAIEERLELRKTMGAIQQASVNEEKKKTAQTLYNAFRQREKDYNDRLELYPKGIPTAEEIEKVRGFQRTATTTAEDDQKLSPNELERLDALSLHFPKGVPSQEKIDEINDDIGNLDSLRASLPHETKSSEVEDIIRRFKENSPSEDEVSKYREKLQSYKDVCHEYENTDSTLGKSTTRIDEKKTSKALSIALFVAAAVLAIGGIVACFFLLALGIVLIAIGIVSLCVGVFFLKKKGTPQQVVEEERVINPKKQSLGEQKNALRSEISTWLSRYYIDDPNPISGMSRFESEYKIYTNHLKGQEQIKAETEKLNTDIRALEKSVRMFFDQYQYQEEDYHSLLLKLQKDCAEFESLTQRKALIESSESKRAEMKQDAAKNIESFREKYDVTDGDLSQWLTDAATAEQALKQAKKELESAKEAYSKYKQENPIADADTPDVTIDELQDREANLNQTIADKKNEIANLEGELDKLDELLHDEEDLKKQVSELKRRHKILSSVKKDIESAQETIKEKYVGPIRKEFERYSELIRQTSGLTIDLDANLELRYFAEGEYRKSLHLSDGERMLVSFCLRLALLENMYKGSEVFAILDDPFVTLDDINLPKVLDSLNKLNSSTQVLYLTCHKSRLPS